MTLLDLFQKHEVLTREVVDTYWLSQSCSPSKRKEEEERIRQDNERALRLIKEIDELTNRIYEALATHYVDIDGTRLSLATIHQYIISDELSCLSHMGNHLGEYDACKVPAFHPKYFNARLNYFQTLNRSKYVEATEGNTILADPLKLHDEVRDQQFSFMSKLRNEYVKQLVAIEV